MECGDYTITSNGSFVRVLGQLRAFDLTQSLTTQSTSNLAVGAFTPLSINDGLNYDWSAGARIDAFVPLCVYASTPTVVPSLFNAITAGSGRIGMTIENRLSGLVLVARRKHRAAASGTA